MMKIDITQIAKLRKETGLGLGKVRGALMETEGDFEAAKTLLRERSKEFVNIGETNEGTVAFYQHHNSQIGAMVEINCMTDFNAKSDEFKGLAESVAMHIAGANPSSVSPEDISPELVETELNRVLATATGKPERVIERIKEGAMKKFYAQNCLLNQPFVRDESKTISELLNEFAAKTGEGITIKRFARFAIGQ